MGSVYIIDELRGFGIAGVLIENLVANLDDNFKEIPIFAVVTQDNKPSRKLFKKICWREQELSEEETDDFNKFMVGKSNIFEGWGQQSVIYWHK